jgi:uncharacterized protein (TIGR00251 family)
MTQNIFTFLTQKGNETLLSAYIQPKAGKNEFAGLFQERLKIRICAPPVEGEANRECINFLSKTLGISKSEITLIRGEQSRQKTFLIARSVDFVAMKFEGIGLPC